MHTLSLGILAHVDAGKTTLTERLLYDAGVIDQIGSVDAGSTQTDSLALERQRGITIKSAVVSFAIDDLTVNLVDTPGHPDFIAEVERVLQVLDGAVLVISAVEGVQAQTRVLLRALRRMRIPTLIFVNKIDRGGARGELILPSIADRLTGGIIALGTVRGAGTRDAQFVPYPADDPALTSPLLNLLAERDDGLLAAYVRDEASVTGAPLHASLARQVRQAAVHPVFFGSAITGAGVDALMAGIRGLLPATEGGAPGPTSGTVFKVERGPSGEKIAYARLFSGTIRTRQRVRIRGDHEEKVTAISVFAPGGAVVREAVAAGQIGKLWGLAGVQIGDRLGDPDAATAPVPQFAPPTLEAVVVPVHAADRAALRVALDQLAEQDPLINVRRDEVSQESSVSLYGEVQKEVIQATLAHDYGIEVAFKGSVTVCVERPAGTGVATELLGAASNPFRATIGLRIEPARPGSGIAFRLQAEPRTLPLHIYKNAGNFAAMMEQYVRRALRRGRYGWEVTDCTVSMIECGYSVADGPPSQRGPDSKAADFRKLTPLVVGDLLANAGTTVCEPIHRFHLEIPADTLGAVLPALARVGAVPQTPEARGPSYLIEGEVPAARVDELRPELPALTRGEGMMECAFARYRPVRSAAPYRGEGAVP